MRLKVVQEPWYSEGLKFQCTGCGNCCTGGPGYVWISSVEIGRLAEHLKLPREQVIEKYCRRIGSRYSLNEHRNARGQYDCTFLKEVPQPKKGGDTVVHSKRVCTIYPVRPLQCRTWPFWDGLLSSEENWKSATERCPGMDRGRHYTREEIEALRDAEDWPKKSPGSGE